MIFFALDDAVSLYKIRNPKLLYVLRTNTQNSLIYKHACKQASTPDIGVDVPDPVILEIHHFYHPPETETSNPNAPGTKSNYSAPFLAANSAEVVASLLSSMHHTS